jgi:acyl-CoA synthetase (AMP-forming)/AMP-acid ligase II
LPAFYFAPLRLCLSLDLVSVTVANANIARHLSLMAATRPQAPALKIPRGRTSDGRIDYLTLTFDELNAEVDSWCGRLISRGVWRGNRTLVMVRPGLPLIASVFALFKLGAVPVVIDPGIDRETFLTCIARSRPRALIGIPSAQLASHVFRKAFSSVSVRIRASNAITGRLTKARSRKRVPGYEVAVSASTDLAAILFTSGSTGSPKGVCYEHGMFDAQVRLIRGTYDIVPGEIDLPLLPIFALFNPALGMTTIVPELDPRQPATVDPAKIVQAILQEDVTSSFGSPTLWKKIGAYCVANKITLPSMRRVLCAGAPVPEALWEMSRTFLSNGQLHSPYGATEALPITSIASEEKEKLKGFGACVGYPVSEIDVRIIEPSDGRIVTMSDTQELRQGGIGEIIVRGPVVTKTYDDNPPATTAAKIAFTHDFGTGFWHRMGDCGYLDAEGRLWFCGRKVERVHTPDGTLYTEPCEQIFRVHPRAERCALVGLGPPGQQVPALVVETKLANPAEGSALARELYSLGAKHPHTAAIIVFFFRPKFPVDVRHNAKIHRHALAKWAATADRFEIRLQPD